MLIMLLAVELQFCQSCNTTQAFPGNFETKNASQTDHCFAAQLNSCERQWLFRLPGCKCPSLPQLSFTALAKQPNSHFFVILFVHLFKKNASESFLASSFKALPCRSQKQKKPSIWPSTVTSNPLAIAIMFETKETQAAT